MSKLWDEEREHPSYGSISACRTMGRIRLFGSKVHHNSYITLRISNAKMTREYGEDRHSTEHKSIIEVCLSPQQWAEFLTTMNVYGGVPCTIRSLGNDMMPPVPEEESIPEKARRDFRNSMQVIVEGCRENIEKARSILEKPTIGKADRKDLMECLSRMAQHFASNSEFAVSQFEKEVDRGVMQGKAEIDGFLSNALMALGADVVAEKFKVKDALMEAVSVALIQRAEGEE